MKNITVIGGGNFGSLLSAKFSQRNNVVLYTSQPNEYTRELTVYQEDTDSYYHGKIIEITNDLEKAIQSAQWIFITYPPILFEAFAKQLLPLLRSGQHLVGVPGSSGFELFFRDALKCGCTITGLQRVHSVARIIERGKSVKESGVRNGLKCASLPRSFNEEAADFLSELYGIPVKPMDNYLNITLINSNPILHTSRLYSIFQDYETVHEYDSLPLFYEEWSLESSELMVAMDKELFQMIEILCSHGFSIYEITTLLDHYESTNESEMTEKIRSIKSLQGLTTPFVKEDNGKLIPDFHSRYFTADFPLGLDILLSFSSVLHTDCPNMKTVSDWYHRITKTENNFELKSFGIGNIDDLLKLYEF